jgi:hypothetical protein
MSLKSIILFANVAVIVLWLIAAVLIYLPHDASAGQLIVDIILLPTVAFGFYLGILELRKQRELPDLDVIWTISDAIELEQPDDTPIGVRLAPLIVNKGNASTIWFTVQLEMPKSLIITSRNIKLHRIIGGDDNWKQFKSDVSYNFTFMSNGQIVMYPGYKMPCCYIDFHLLPNRQYPDECRITYTIITDKTKASRGFCFVKIKSSKAANRFLGDILSKDVAHNYTP